MYRLDQGQSYLPEKQTALEDRYYNNQSFQEDYPVNDPEVNNAALKIQSKFRGHKARQDVERMRQENKQVFDADQQDLGYGREQSATPDQDENQTSYRSQQKASPLTSPRVPPQETKVEDSIRTTEEEDVPQIEQELTEEEKEEQERAARSIQARFRGFKDRRSANRDHGSPGSGSDQGRSSGQQHRPDSENETSPTPTSARLSGKMDSDRHDLSGNLTANDQIETGENDDTDRPRLQREPTQLSEDFERHTQIPRDSDFAREQRSDLNNEDIDMNDPNLEKAATRIQAQFRGYKTRKDLATEDVQDQTSTSPRTHDEYDNSRNKSFSPTGEGHKEAEGEDDDNAAAIKIQAAYRGYKTRKDLEK